MFTFHANSNWGQRVIRFDVNCTKQINVFTKFAGSDFVVRSSAILETEQKVKRKRMRATPERFQSTSNNMLSFGVF